nr:hypothetical transcript [Hymenolepis microstoma]
MRNGRSQQVEFNVHLGTSGAENPQNRVTMNIKSLSTTMRLVIGLSSSTAKPTDHDEVNPNEPEFFHQINLEMRLPFQLSLSLVSAF